jgi:alpha-glucosidase
MLIRGRPDGMEVRIGRAVMTVTALTDHVLRVQAAERKLPPEDGSWAVLPAARSARVRVRPERGGFSTAALHVTLEGDCIQVRDRSGALVSADAREARFDDGGFSVFKRIAAGERFFGLGDKAGPLDRRGQAFTLWNTDAYGYQEGTDPLYKAVPFFMGVDEGGRAYGVLLDNTWRSHFDFGRRSPDRLEFGAEGGPLDYYLLDGPDPKAVLERYAWLTGTPPLPPRWALGFQQSRWGYGGAARVRDVASRLRSERIPADVIWLDIDYQDRNRPFTVDRGRFPDFDTLLFDLKRQGFSAVMITDPHIAEAPGEGYGPFDTGAAGDHFIRRPDGAPFSGEVWPGASRFPDFTRAETRDWWGGLYLRFPQAAGFWNDMNEPAVFGDTDVMQMTHRIEEPGFHRRTASHAEIHNVWGMQNARATYEGMLRLRPDQRPFVLTRASFAGGHRHAWTWTGDNSSTWNHLRLSTPQLLNLALSGFGFSGEDIGGFAADPGPDLLTRWHQIGAFRPLFRNHSQKRTRDQEPWTDGPEHTRLRRSAIEERYRLLPYLYTLAEEASRTGVPMMRPVFLEIPAALASLREHEGWFMLGPHILVAPARYLESPNLQVLELPPGDWFDYWTGKPVVMTDTEQPFQGGVRMTRCLVRAASLQHLPVFVRAGGIIAKQPLVQHTKQTPLGPLELHVYPGPDGAEGDLYWDDGETFAYRRGDFLRQRFRWEGDLETVASEGAHRPWWSETRVVVHHP